MHFERQLFVAAVLLSILAYNFSAYAWTHEQQSSWPSEFPECGGSRQSPIDLKQNQRSDLLSLNYNNYNSLLSGLLLNNDGYTARVILPMLNNSARPSISGAGLNGSFYVDSLHFHWGSKSLAGSEHTIAGQHYDAEMHIVHTKPDTAEIAVIGVLLLSSKTNNIRQPYKLTQIFKSALQVQSSGNTYNLPYAVALNDLLGNEKARNGYRYEGSLTTPPCSETVSWIVYKKSITVSSIYLQLLFKLKNDLGKPILNNFRRTQALNDGKVKYFQYVA